MPGKAHHITVCICTFKRPELLKRLLHELAGQETGGLFEYSVVVADNDQHESARPVVAAFTARSTSSTSYCVEKQQNIALARNKALEHAHGDFIAFIDDDEYPSPDWLCRLFKTCTASGADGVLGPVLPYFEKEPPHWAVKGKLFERPGHETGHRIALLEARTGNLLLRREILDDTGGAFRAKFGTGGEDTDFFARMMARGRVFVWCNEAPVYEAVPAARCTRSYLLRRALHRGNISFELWDGGMGSLAKSFIAVPAYALAAPFLYLAGDHHCMRYLIKFCDHAGKLLALFRIKPFKERDL